MKFVSWNCRGFGSTPKEEALKDIIKTSKAEILLIQETKMEGQDFLRKAKARWNISSGIAESARGASGGLGTIWNSKKYDLLMHEARKHWIFTSLLHLETGRQVSLFNLYVPVLPEDKKSCWETLRDFLQQNVLDNIILGGDLNLTLSANEKKGGSIVRDQAREWVEDLMSTWELEDIKPVKGKYTWSNKRVGPGHIAARLDRFLVQSSFLVLGLNPDSTILPHSVSDHKPISLSLTADNNLGPIPFRFNPRWIQEESYPRLGSQNLEWYSKRLPLLRLGRKAQKVKKSFKSLGQNPSKPHFRATRSTTTIRSSSARNGRCRSLKGKLAARGKAAKNLAPSMQRRGKTLATKIEVSLARSRG
jgi:exonuclease III